MRLSHFDLDNRTLIAKKVDWLIFVSGLDLDARLSYQYVTCVDSFWEFDNGSFFCIMKGIFNSFIMSKFRIHNNLLAIFDLWDTSGCRVLGWSRSNSRQRLWIIIVLVRCIILTGCPLWGSAPGSGTIFYCCIRGADSELLGFTPVLKAPARPGFYITILRW